MNKEQSVTLLRQNKRKQVAALNALGFASVTVETRASLFDDYIKWARGLLDVRVAAVRISDGAKFYLTIQEWESLTTTNKALFVRQGVRIRANGLDFILAASAIGTFAWGGTYDVATVPNYPVGGSSCAFNYNTLDALTLTECINSAYGTTVRNGVEGAPAAKAALEYKAFRKSNDGVEDDAKWCLPTPKHCLALYLHKEAINDVLRRAWSSDNIVTDSPLWTCFECGNSTAWQFKINYGGANEEDKVTSLTVRPITLFNT